jgi:hypothetical protein
VSVAVTEAATLSSNIIAQNTSTTSPAAITGKLTGTVQILGMDNPFDGSILANTQTITVPPFNGTDPPFTGASTVKFPPLAQTQTETFNYTQPADLKFFTATTTTSTISPTLVANAQSIASAPNGNLQSQVTTSGSGVITVTYTYIPATPEVVKLVRFGIHHQPTVLQVNYSGNVVASEAGNPTNYKVLLPNSKGSFTGPGVTVISIASAAFNPVTNTATLVTAKRLNFHKVAELVITLPSNNGNVITVQFGGVNSLGGFLDKNGNFVPFVPGVTNLPM